jgi:hypothetical protein
MDNIVDMKFSVIDADGTVNAEKAAALTRFASAWGELEAHGATVEELEALIRMASMMVSQPGVPKMQVVGGDISTTDIGRAFVDGLAHLVQQFASFGMSEQDFRGAAEAAIARAFGRVS